MPYVKLQCNKNVDNENELLKKLSKKAADELGKPESYVMVALETSQIMSFAGSTEPCVFMEVKSIGLSDKMTEGLSKGLCDFIEKELKIDSSRVYIEFSNAEGAMWGWKGSTF